MVELRKRSAPASEAPAPKKHQSSTPSASKSTAASKTKAAVDSVKKPSKAPSKGDQITLDGFGGEIATNEGTKTTLAKLVGDSKAGVVLFTYPKASTPGCKSGN